MESSELAVSRVRLILSWIHEHLVPLLLIGLCCLIGFKFGRFALFFVCAVAALMIGLPIALYKGVLEPLLWGVQCPTCREWGLVRIACISFGSRFYLCDRCGQRCKRLDYGSPWIDASSKEDADMYKPVPFFGPARKREAWICAWKALGSLAAIFLFPLLGGLMGGERGSSFGSVIGVVILLSATQRNEKKIIPFLPILWDWEVDGKVT